MIPLDLLLGMLSLRVFFIFCAIITPHLTSFTFLFCSVKCHIQNAIFYISISVCLIKQCCLCCKYDSVVFLLHYILHSCCCSSCFISMFCKFIASPLSVHHSLMFVLFCFVLFCSAPLCPPISVFRWPACIWGLVFSAVPVPPPPGVNIEEHIQIRQEEKRQRINRRHRLEEGRGMDQGEGGNIYGLCRFCFMHLGEMSLGENDKAGLETEYSVSIPFFSPSTYNLQVLPQPGCCALVFTPLLVLVFFCVCFLV